MAEAQPVSSHANARSYLTKRKNVRVAPEKVEAGWSKRVCIPNAYNVNVYSLELARFSKI